MSPDLSPVPYDAVLLVSFGGPEGPDEVMPFLENVTRGRSVPAARLASVAEHYRARGGVSPINGINRRFRAALEAELTAAGPELPVYWGNRNWHPLLADTVRQMRDDGVRRALAFVTSPYASYSGCRQYLDDLAAARSAVGARAPELERLRHYFDHPAFVESFVRSTAAAAETLPPDQRSAAQLVFTAHSIPDAMARTSGPAGGMYAAQLRATARLVADGVAGRSASRREWSFAYQSRSGPSAQPWLGPDVNDHLCGLADRGVPAVVVVPVGFTADHMEVVHDLDTEAARTATRCGLGYARAGTPGTDPALVTMAAELVRERTDGAPRRALSRLGPSHDRCPATCCPAPARP